jgi:hypothetical protein
VESAPPKESCPLHIHMENKAGDKET